MLLIADSNITYAHLLQYFLENFYLVFFLLQKNLEFRLQLNDIVLFSWRYFRTTCFDRKRFSVIALSW